MPHYNTSVVLLHKYLASKIVVESDFGTCVTAAKHIEIKSTTFRQSMKGKSSLASNAAIYDHVDSNPTVSGFDRSANAAQRDVEDAQHDEQPLLEDQEDVPEEEVVVATGSSTSNHYLNGHRPGARLTTQIPRDRNVRRLSISPSPHPQTRAAQGDEEANRPTKSKSSDGDEKVTWSSLPRKGQLAVLTLARLSEPLTQTSLQSYLYYQLELFDPSQAPSQITSQAGLVIAAFAAAQAVTAVVWGTVADAQWGGRKFVIIIGLCGTGLGSLGYGFSGSWQVAVFWRILSGSLNGNVGVMRTMISEIVREKKCVERSGLYLGSS